MGSSALILTYYGLLRLSRRRSLIAVLLGLPLVAAGIHGMMPVVPVWMCIVACAAMVAVVIWFRHLSDRASGLATAVTCTPISASEIVWSKLLTGAALFAAQMVLFAGLRAIWPGGRI